MRKRLVVIGVIVVLLVAGFAFGTGGKPRRFAPSWLSEQPIAHRGLWTEGPEAPENSLAAFEAAVNAGYTVELDVHMTGDGEVVVIHDDDIERMTGVPGMVGDMQLAELTQLRLLGGDELIPTLAEALATIDGEVPVLVEIKNPGEIGRLEDEVARELLAYDGDVAVMSFNPFSLARMAEAAPEISRGQLSGAFEGEDLAFHEKFLLRNLLLNWSSKPDFIAYELAELPSLGTKIQQWRGRPLLGWTANTPEEREAARAYCDGVVCNPGALPEE